MLALPAGHPRWPGAVPIHGTGRLSRDSLAFRRMSEAARHQQPLARQPGEVGDGVLLAAQVEVAKLSEAQDLRMWVMQGFVWKRHQREPIMGGAKQSLLLPRSHPALPRLGETLASGGRAGGALPRDLRTMLHLLTRAARVIYRSE